MKLAKSTMLTLAMTVSALSGGLQAASFEVTNPVLKGVSGYGSTADDGGLCICEKVNGSWVCRPVGCIGQFSSPEPTDLRRQPVERQTLPGDQYLRLPPSPGEGSFSRNR